MTDNAHTMNNDTNLSHLNIVGNIITSGVNKFLFTFKAVVSFPLEFKQKLSKRVYIRAKNYGNILFFEILNFYFYFKFLFLEMLVYRFSK